LENAEQKIQQLEGQLRFTQSAEQVVHDIRSPLACLLMIVESCNAMPEMERIALREAAMNINDMRITC